MHSPTTTATTAAATYTTIPISGADVISRSFQNLSSSLSRSRPWPEFLAGAGSFVRPDSLAGAGIRLRCNAKYFGANYAILTSACAAASLIGSPVALIVAAFVGMLWLVLYFFREDPLVVLGRHVSDWAVMVGLVTVSVLAVWFTGILNNLLIGIGVGVLISAVHGVFRNPEGLFLDENEAASDGLIRPRSNLSLHTTDFL
ncbi:hypothetical protein RJ639_008342 [Escallonia herrerae]|uniref:PRA1 family protein n=1 Tax=Escallonia herrerae TaxID=1293975 RepID=A0AA89AQU2_9ASTE|nr:hypothetical protein RJ639_008342 [Escallonia herrerae]